MSFTKITSEDLADKGVVGLPDTPNLSVTALQKKFDEIATDVIVPKFNGLVDELDAYEVTVNVNERVKSTEITDIRTDEDENLQISRDNGKTWSATASSGHIIEDGNGTPYPSRGRLQFSSNVNISDDPTNNATFIQVAAGEKGDPGDDATITVGNVTSSGTNVSVTNVGSPSNAIFDFVLPKGDDGQSATIQVGTVVSGQNASVLNRGTSSNAIFDFILPKGDKGDAGTSFQIKGLYPTLSDLIAAHPIGNKGDAYAVGTSTFNEIYNWNNDTRTWDNLGSLQGAKGDPGDAATVTVGTVTTLNPTDPATVQNDGTTDAAIFSFGIPKGDKGDKGDAATIAIGNVTKGTNPSVTNVGTSTNAIFDMVLPKGDKGDPSIVNGKQGASIQLTGADIQLIGYRNNVQGAIDPSDTINQAISKLVSSSGGAKIIVTADADTVGNTLTCTKGSETYSQVIGASEQVTFVVADVGTWTIKNVETEREVEVEVPYFGVYHTTLGIGDVIIQIDYASDYVGSTFKIDYDGKQKTKVADSSLTMSFVFGDYTTYEVSNTYDDKTKTFNITEGGTYVATFDVAAFDYQGWLDSASITDSYASLDEVLADEKALRILFTKHASVDYLVERMEADDTDGATIFNNDYVAKWINLRDYALDTLYASETCKALMDEVDKYGYGEWVTNEQEGVPTMTSNTAPSGECIGGDKLSSTYDYYMAFDSNNSTMWDTTTSDISKRWLGYDFGKPVKVSKFYYLGDTGHYAASFTVDGSNDKSTWETIETISGNTSVSVTKNINPTKEYRYYRLHFLTLNSGNECPVYTLQFYGLEWQPKGNVPLMTSETAPYGTVIKSSENSNVNRNGWKAFSDHSDGTYRVWQGQDNNAWLGYKFVNPICVRGIRIVDDSASPNQTVTGAEVEGSNDGTTWTSIYTISKTSTTTDNLYKFDNDTYYMQVRMRVTSTKGGTISGVTVQQMQFYGRELTALIPRMTSNTEPKGEAFATSYVSAGHEAYKAFNQDTGNWNSKSSDKSPHVGYDFGEKTKVLFATVEEMTDGYQAKTAVTAWLWASNTGSGKTGDISSNSDWECVSDYTASSITYTGALSLTKECNYRYYALKARSSSYNFAVGEIQLWGFDYSEREFEDGSTMKFIYDHGVELEKLVEAKLWDTPPGSLNPTYKDDSISISSNASTWRALSAKIDVTPYKLLFSKIKGSVKGDSYTSTVRLCVASQNVSSGNSDDNIVASITLASSTTNLVTFEQHDAYYLDVSSVNGQNEVGFRFVTNSTAPTLNADIDSMWLE